MVIGESSEVTIERAGLESLDAIESIEQASFTAPWSKKALAAELTGNPFSEVWLARSPANGPVLGYVCFWIVFEELRMMNLAVAPHGRRRGIGGRLVAHALHLARARGAHRGFLEVRAANAAAQALYERAGFRRVGVRAGYYSQPVEDAVLMEWHGGSTVDRLDATSIESSATTMESQP